MGNHMPYGITQCYLPPSRGDFPAFTPAEADTRFSDPGGMQGWVDLRGYYILPNTVTYLRHNQAVSWPAYQALAANCDTAHPGDVSGNLL